MPLINHMVRPVRIFQGLRFPLRSSPSSFLWLRDPAVPAPHVSLPPSFPVSAHAPGLPHSALPPAPGPLGELLLLPVQKGLLHASGPGSSAGRCYNLSDVTVHPQERAGPWTVCAPLPQHGDYGLAASELLISEGDAGPSPPGFRFSSSARTSVFL